MRYSAKPINIKTLCGEISVEIESNPENACRDHRAVHSTSSTLRNQGGHKVEKLNRLVNASE